MRDIYLFTKNPINHEKCEGLILEKIKNVATNKKGAFWSTSNIFWDVDINNETVYEGVDDPDYIKELTEWVKNIPIEEPFVNHIGIHRSIDAKRIIHILMSIYSELYINVDDGTDWYGTAQEYLDTEFDY